MSTPSPKRIVRLVSRLNISGKAVQAILLSAEMEKFGYETILVSSEHPIPEDNLAEMVESLGVESIELPYYTYTRPSSVLPALWRTYKLMRDLKPDIVHTHNSAAGFTGRIAARLAGVPVVVHTLHEYPFRGYYSRYRTVMFIYLERIGAYLSDSIITLSQSLRQALTSTYNIVPVSRITVLPLGYALQSFAETPRHQGIFRQAWQIPDDAPLIGIIGRLQPVKNHRLFLDAAAQMLQHRPDARFAIIGDGPERRRLEAYSAQLGLASQVIFTGWQHEMEPIYSDLDVLVNTSRNEGTPVPIIEALTTRCPVVAMDVGGIADLLNNGAFGRLIATHNANDLMQAILETLDHPPDMSEAQATMLRRYDIERLAQDLDSLYRGLYKRKTSHSN